MSDLVNPLQSLIDQAAQLTPKKSGAGTVQAYAQRLNPKKASGSLLLLDVSSSMDESVGSLRKIDLLRLALDRPLQSGERAIAFNSISIQIPSLQEIPEPNGGTAMHAAILEAVPLRPRSTLIVSDGQPDDAKQALAAAKKLTGLIHTLYIGRDNDAEAIEFMRKLARLGCGRTDVHDVSKNSSVSALQGKITLLLPGVEP